MNYKRIHDSIIERAKTRVNSGYTETHHIIPKCLGGTNENHNLVELTPEEHFLIHILLVKIFPDNHNLIFAVKLMCEHDSTNRVNNKMYGWIKRLHSKETSVKFKKMWSNPQKRQQIIASMKVSFNTPECKSKKSELMKKDWKENKQKRLPQIQQLQKDYKQYTAKINSDKWKLHEFREKMKSRKPRGPDGEKLKSRWADPVWREKMLSARKVARERKKYHEANENN